MATRKGNGARTAWGDPGQRARRREAATRRREAAAEKRKLKNERAAAKTRIRTQNGGAGLKIVVFEETPKSRKKTVVRGGRR